MGTWTELEFWAESLHDFNSQPIWHNPGVLRVVYSDASSTGYGGYMVEHGMHVAEDEIRLTRALGVCADMCADMYNLVVSCDQR